MNVHSTKAKKSTRSEPLIASSLAPVVTGLASSFAPVVANAPRDSNLVNFYGREFIINQDVLIPRPETEQIIDAVLNLAGKPYLPGVKPGPNKLPKNPTILDVGTGSGCIAITLKKELPESTIYATDISEKAIKIAQKNADKHSASIFYIISYLLEDVKFNRGNKPNIIIANLPYVDPEWPWLDKESLKQDPDIALYADNHGLALIYELIEESNKTGAEYLILESDPCQHDQVTSYALNNNYKLLETRGFIQVFKLTSCTHPKSR